MIKEKTVYYSTETDKEYHSLTEAILEDNAAGTSSDNVRELLQKFESVKHEFYSELRSAREASKQSLAKRIAEIHSQYDDTLDLLAEQLAQNGINPAEVQVNKSDDETLKKKPRKRTRVVKVRIDNDTDTFPCKRFL